MGQKHGGYIELYPDKTKQSKAVDIYMSRSGKCRQNYK